MPAGLVLGAALVLALVLAWRRTCAARASAQATAQHLARVAAQEARLQGLWAAMPVGVVVHAAEGTIVEANPAAEQLLGLSSGQLLGRGPLDGRWRWLRGDGSEVPRSEYPAMRTLTTGEPVRNETMGVHTPQGALRWLLVNTEVQRDAGGAIAGVVACFSDITDSRGLQEHLSDSTCTDALTRLPNRSVVVERLRQALAHARRHPGYGFAVLFMDFDRFKQVNDTLGHGAGDELLRQIALRLQLALRPGDALARVEAPTDDPTGTTAARLGGDEFVVVLEGVHEVATVAVVADRLLRELAEPYVVDCTPVQSSASIGIVLCNGDLAGAPEGDDAAAAEELLRDADTAMVEAKRAGRGRWVLFDPAMHDRVVRAMAMESDLRAAVKNGELYVVYQPVVEMPTRAMVGAEALVRWRHARRGLVPPAEFIPVAEECGLIDAIGDFVLRQACAQFASWRQSLGALAPRCVAVNFSRAQLQRADAAEGVRAVLEAHGMQPGELQLEITESLAAQDERVQASLRVLKQLGVKLALDDFGTGYSSLACLHQLPVDTVKLHQSFVQHAQDVEYHRVLIEATVRVARTLGMSTVAEGIETEGQAALMEALGCDGGQGWLFSRAQDGSELERWALARQPADALSEAG